MKKNKKNEGQTKKKNNNRKFDWRMKLKKQNFNKSAKDKIRNIKKRGPK
jgi:hypothetical protein